MRNFFRSAAACIALIGFQASPSFAQTAAPNPAPTPAPAAAVVTPVATTPAYRMATPALWEVKDRDTTIYLFGTIHLLPKGVAWNRGAVKTALDRSDTIRLEIANIDAETPAIAAMMATQSRLPAGEKLTDGLTDAQKTALETAIKESGVPAAAFENAKPWFASLLLAIGMIQKLGMDPNQGVDKILDTLARSQGKPVEGFETGAEQIGFFASLSPSAGRAMLLSTLEDWKKGPAMMTTMVDDWSAGRSEGVGKLMSESMRTQPEFAAILLTDRNRRWADWISARMAQPGTVFVAVGAGHLEGDDSVQNFLKAKGLKATRIANPATPAKR